MHLKHSRLFLHPGDHSFSGHPSTPNSERNPDGDGFTDTQVISESPEEKIQDEEKMQKG